MSPPRLVPSVHDSHKKNKKKSPQRARVVAKMAARWGAGEAMLTACNMDFFSTNTLDEVKYNDLTLMCFLFGITRVFLLYVNVSCAGNNALGKSDTWIKSLLHRRIMAWLLADGKVTTKVYLYVECFHGCFVNCCIS